MSDYTKSKPHVSYETRLRAVQAVLQGLSRREVAQAYGIDRATLCRWILRFQAAGEEGLCRKPGSGRPPKKNDSLCEGSSLQFYEESSMIIQTGQECSAQP